MPAAGIVMVIAVVLIVAALSGLLAWRNVTAERRISAAATLQSSLETRTRTFVELARASGPTDGAQGEGLENAAENAAAACSAKRVAVWRLSPDRTAMLCEDCFDLVAQDHTTGMELHRDQLPNLFAALGNGAPIDSDDAAGDRRTAELFESYLAPLGISSVYIVPIISRGRLLGMLTVFAVALSYGLTLRARNESALGPMMTTISQPIMLVSGVLLPLTLAPLWLRRIADVNPFYWATNGMRSLFEGHAADSTVWLSLIIVVALAVVTISWSVRLFARAVQ